MRSSVYSGLVTHVRRTPVEHSFRYRHVLFSLDLDELPRAFEGRWLWSHESVNVVSFRRSDYYGDARVPLDVAVRARVRDVLGRAPAGPISLLTQPRFLGYVFNPVSFYYCYAADGTTLEAILAEITNTPWGERHDYVLDARQARAGTVSARFAKAFHVSPFLDMNYEYDWRFGALDEHLSVHMANWAHGAADFEVRLELERRPFDAPSLARALMQCPGLSLRAAAAIYWQALRLKWKGAPFHAHPGTKRSATTLEAP